MFYQYALGSARESRDWYYKGRHILGPVVVDHRLQLLTEVIRLMLTIIPQQRGASLHEDSFPYQPTGDVQSIRTDSQDSVPINTFTDGAIDDFAHLLAHVPMPDLANP
jgi:hypothetical protein